MMDKNDKKRISELKKEVHILKKEAARYPKNSQEYYKILSTLMAIDREIKEIRMSPSESKLSIFLARILLGEKDNEKTL